jgi:hypothetical protein
LFNWVRQGLVTGTGTGRQLAFQENHINQLKNKLVSGEIRRLSGRANRTRSRKRLMQNPEEVKLLEEQLPGMSGSAQVENLLLGFCRLILDSKGFEKGIPVLDSWEATLKAERQYSDTRGILAYLPPYSGDDPAGMFYQELISLGSRGAYGTFYTPAATIGQILARFTIPDGPVWDPCCGSGGFLTALADKGVSSGLLHGSDRDAVSVNLALFNLYLKTGMDFSNRILLEDSLDLKGKRRIADDFSMVITNPPWGRNADGYGDRGESTRGKQEDAFARFIRLGVEHLRPGGLLVYLLPESILGVQKHAPIRGFLSETCELVETVKHGRVFSGVMSRAVTMIWKKRKNPGRVSAVSFFQQTRARDQVLLDRIREAPARSLSENTRWVMGIVTGDNNRFVGTEPGKDNIPVLVGQDIFREMIRKPTRYLTYDRARLQQCGSENLYKSPKIVYRFITEDPVFAYDDSGYFMLNSVNALIPDKSVLTLNQLTKLLNQPLIRFYYRTMFGGIKILKRNLERIPVPLVDSFEEDLSAEDLAVMLYRYYGLTRGEIRLLEEAFSAGMNR